MIGDVEGATMQREAKNTPAMAPVHVRLFRSDWTGWADRLSLGLLRGRPVSGDRLLFSSNSSFSYQISYSVYSSTPCTLHVFYCTSDVLYIVAYSTYFRCILLYSMYSAEGKCTLMYLGVLCCVAGVHVFHPYSECTPVVLCRLR
jgi:hypothetical protein